MPIHVPGEREAGLRLTNPAAKRSVDLPATLTARVTGDADLSVDLPCDELVDGRWRLELILPSTGVGKPVALPLALDVSASGGAVVKRLVAEVADLAAKGPRRRSSASRLAVSTFLRRAAGKLRRALKK